MDGSGRTPRGGVSPVAVFTIVMAVAAILPSQHQCSPTKFQPALSAIEVRNIACKSGKVVANMVGYLELLGATPIYLPLDASSIYNAMYHHDHSKHSLVMQDDNVHVRIEYHEKDGGNSYEFTGIEMSANNGTLPVDSFREICNFDRQFAFSLPADSRYSCKRVLSHQCSDGSVPVANLVLKSFEIELDGDQDKIANREFGKPAWDESCDQWQGSEQSI